MKTINRMRGILVAFLALIPATASAVNEKGDWPWNLKLHGWHDRAIAEDLGVGWFLNVGPTGLRARITHEHPEFLTIKYVFKKSPADGLIKIDDIIVGANGKRLTVAHTFGRGSRGRGGWEGPMLDMSKLIEDSQGKDGKLELIIWPSGKKADEKTVTLQIPPISRFSETWPYNCPRSDKLMTDLCDFLADEYKRAGKFENQVQTHTASVLALLASGNKKYDSLLRDIMSGYEDKRYDPNNEAGFPAWSYGYDGILMGEYYLRTKDRSLLKAIESLTNCLELGQTPDSGGFSHKPFPAIQQRVAAGGPKGYGDMAMPGGLTMLAMSLFKQAAIPYAAPAHERLHQAYLCSMNPSGAIGYGFQDWDHAVIMLQKPSGPPKNSPKGIGYLCPEGMTGIGEYKITWPTKADPRYKPTDWVAKETATNKVYDMGGATRLVIRSMLTAAPTKPYRHDGNPCDHFGRTGVGALAHAIGNGGDKSWGFVSDFLATGAAMSHKSLLDGHASTHIHVLWGSLGASLAREKDFREYMEGIKWWFIMAQAHDGGFVVMPGRDYASTDHVYGTRNLPTACAALILSLKEKQLQITGASRSGAVPVAARPAAIIQPKARTMYPEKRLLLDQSLLTGLAEISHAGALKPLAMSISKTQSKVWLAKVDKDSKLVFKTIEGEQQTSFSLDELNQADLVLLSRLAAKLRPTDQESQARAGIYLELSGDAITAKSYYAKAGPDIQQKLDAIFE